MQPTSGVAVLRFDEIQLEAMAREHVAYEINGLSLWSATGIPVQFFAVADESYRQATADAVAQATAESGLIHLRCIAAFLMNEQPRPNSANWLDLVADDYFDDKWKGRPTHLFGTDEKQHRAHLAEIHRRLAHLTLQRLNFEFTWTEITSQVPHVLHVFRAFVRELLDTHPERGEWFHRCLFQMNAREMPGRVNEWDASVDPII